MEPSTFMALKQPFNRKRTLFLSSLLLISFLLVFCLGSFTIFKKKEKIHVKSNEFFIETFIEVSPGSINVKDQLTYYWYKMRSIQSTKGGYSGNLLHGGFQKFNQEKKLIENGEFLLGLKHKTWKTWYNSGEIKSICTYKKGMKNGVELMFDTNGLVISENHFYKGNLKN